MKKKGVMLLTIGQCYDKVRKLLNYYSAGGNPLSAREGDLWPRAAALMDTAQREFARLCPRLESRVLTQHTLRNLLPELVPFRVGENAVELCAEGAQSLSFATDGPLEVRVVRTVDGAQEEVAVISCPAGQTQVYAASFAGSCGTVTVRMTGGAYVWDAAMYAQYFAEGCVPAFGAHRWQALPEDCVRVRQLSLQSLSGTRKEDFRDYRLKKGQIGLPWAFTGTATLVYECAPAAITEDSPAESLLEVDDVCGEGMASYAAAWLVAEENPGLHELLMGVYRTMLERSRPGPQLCTQRNTLYLRRTAGLMR